MTNQRRLMVVIAIIGAFFVIVILLLNCGGAGDASDRGESLFNKAIRLLRSLFGVDQD